MTGVQTCALPICKSYDEQTTTANLEKSLYAARLVNYAQGFALMKTVSSENEWGLDLSAIALIWRAGCIIRSAFLGELAQTYRDNPTLENLLLDPHWNSLVTEALPDWQDITASLLRERVAIPACSSALNYYLGLIRSEERRVGQ